MDALETAFQLEGSKLIESEAGVEIRQDKAGNYGVFADGDLMRSHMPSKLGGLFWALDSARGHYVNLLIGRGYVQNAKNEWVKNKK